MKHLLKIAALFGMILFTKTGFSQLPPIPEAIPDAPAPTPVDDSRLFDPPPSLGTYRPAPMPPVESQPAPVQVASPGYYGDTVVPGLNYGPTAWQPGGYTARRGRPYYYTTPGRNTPLYSVHEYAGTPWAFDHSAYQYHFGPGYYRHSEGGTYRFPYYTYRAPWYFPGHPIYNRDTNRPW